MDGNGGSAPVHPLRIGWRRGDPADALLELEWLVANGLGGYAAGTIGGVTTLSAEEGRYETRRPTCPPCASR